MLNKIIYYSFCLLFFLTPLIWTSLNHELFEYNKMIFVYLMTIIITGSWILKIINHKSLIINHTPLTIPLLLFLGANILSTIFSIDQHTSIWGYYSRSNGGLLSLISYLLLYFAFVSNINKAQAIKLLKLAIFSGVIISLYAILEHFGVSPSCVILRGEINADCWVQDVQSRVFATLGQPNWLAAYLAMLILPALYFLLKAATKKPLFTFIFALLTLYLAFTFTYSRGATLGLLIGLGIFLAFYCQSTLKTQKVRLSEILKVRPTGILNSLTYRVILIILIFILINIIFGSALTRFQLTNLLPNQPKQEATQSAQPLNQLENGGTESGQIRLIVWQGALDIFQHYPIFGSGVETFAYAYYQFRPVAHNLVSEWDFLYNKAHNEFLNYLATTGIIGFATYMLVIFTFVLWSLKNVIPNTVRNLPTLNILPTSWKIATSPTAPRNDTLFLVTLLSAYMAYLVQNFFSFSVVIIALFFFLFPAIAFVLTDSTSTFKLPPSKYHLLPSIIHRRKLYLQLTQILIVLSIFYLLLSTIQLWYADTLFAKSERFSDSGNPGQAYNYLSLASTINKNEPFYQSELSYAAAESALALPADEATLSAELKTEASLLTERVLKDNPKNTSYWRTAIRTYFALSGLDKNYTLKTLEIVDQTIKLAPSDAKLYYNKAVILGPEKPEEAIMALQKAIELKPNYRDAYYALALYYFDKKEIEKAVSTMNKVLELVPGDTEALEKLKDWK